MRLGGLRQTDVVYVVHQITIHTALAAAGGHGFFGGFLFNVHQAMARFGSGSAYGPIDRDGFDIRCIVNQPLVAQITSTNSSGYAPRVISVTSSRLSTYTVSARSAGMCTSTLSPNSLKAWLACVSGAWARVSWGNVEWVTENAGLI